MLLLRRASPLRRGGRGTGAGSIGHIDPVMACHHERVQVFSGDTVVDVWPIDLRGWVRKSMSELPRYQDLPAAPRGGRSAWGLFGPDDNLGLVNLLTPERVAAAAGLVRTGLMFPLDLPLGSTSHQRWRSTRRHGTRSCICPEPPPSTTCTTTSTRRPPASAGLARPVGYAPDEFYNGATEADVQSGTRNTIEHWARHGIAGRAILLDIPRAMAEAGRPYEPGAATAIGVEELELARRRTRLEFGVGDIILLHTGFASWYARSAAVGEGAAARPGHRAEARAYKTVGEYLWDTHAAAIASDTYAVEVWPIDPSRPPIRSASCITCSSGSSNGAR